MTQMNAPLIDPLDAAYIWLAQGKSCALAVVTQTWGSAPRPEGALMAVSCAGIIAGSVSAGCVEAAVIAECDDLSGAKQLHFGVSDGDAFEAGLACGGEIKVAVLALGVGDLPLLEAARNMRRARQPTGFALDLRRGGLRPLGQGDYDVAISPRPRMAIIGAGHIAQVLYPMAQALEFDVHILDPRERFAAPARFEGATFWHDWPDTALQKLGVDAQTAVVLLTHDPKMDDPALAYSLRSPAFYIGALGSRRTHKIRGERLASQGFTQRDLARIHGPIGLDIGARSPGEIALSIMAEVTAVIRNNGKVTRR